MFHLEKYTSFSSRYECPRCNHPNEFVRYVDDEGNHVFPDYVGRCNRESKCGYHYTPKMFLHDHPECKRKILEESVIDDIVDNVHAVHKELKENPQNKPVSYVPITMMEETLGNYQNNNFVLFLENLVGREKALTMINRYYVGTTDRWNGSTVFWQVDQDGRVHHGKIMQYNFITGHREKQFSTYEHYKQLPDFNLEQCYFGEHLLKDNDKVVALVESEKTAIIATEFMPDMVWLASGGAYGCMNGRMHVLAGRKVVLFPDLGKERDWELTAARIRMAGATKVSVSHVLENNATDTERRQGLDISDYLIRHMKRQMPEGCIF